ncbi:MAG: hypothetical protein SWO11_21515 [Thermodesulfobacteriota bacterium]|nr:hypothetical protein [Thermodesulfobacteriota bacterium]
MEKESKHRDPRYGELADKCRSTSTYIEAILKCYEVDEIKSIKRAAIMISQRLRTFDQFLNDNFIKRED